MHRQILFADVAVLELIGKSTDLDLNQETSLIQPNKLTKTKPVDKIHLDNFLLKTNIVELIKSYYVSNVYADFHYNNQFFK